STLLTPLGDPSDPRRTPRRLWDPALARRDHPVHPPLSGDARRTAARPRGPQAPVSSPRRDHPLDRRPPTRDAARDPLRRPRVDREAALGVRAVAPCPRGRGPPPGQEGLGVGRVAGCAGGPLVV